jgi:hypothetical protein
MHSCRSIQDYHSTYIIINSADLLFVQRVSAVSGRHDGAAIEYQAEITKCKDNAVFSFKTGGMTQK